MFLFECPQLKLRQNGESEYNDLIIYILAHPHTSVIYFKEHDRDLLAHESRAGSGHG